MKTRGKGGAVSLLAAAVALAGAAQAQTVATYDPAQLPATTGRVAQYSLTPRGDIDGLILDDGTQVHLPPYLGRALAAAVKPGDRVTVRGLKAEALPLVQALSVRDEATGRTVTDTGAPPRPAPLPPPGTTFTWMRVEGAVRAPLYGPRGDLNGALLEDGTQVHLPPDQAAALGGALRPGHRLAAEGDGVTGAYGKALDAQRIGGDAGRMVPVGPAAPPPG